MRLEIIIRGKKVKLLPPNVREYYLIYHAADPFEKTEGLTDWIARSAEELKSTITADDICRIEIELYAWLAREKTKEIYRAPYAPKASQNTIYFNRVYDELKLVSDFTNSSFLDLQVLDIFTFWRYYRDAVIWDCSKSEEGREYLEAAYNSMQTKPDRAAIAQLINSQK